MIQNVSSLEYIDENKQKSEKQTQRVIINHVSEINEVLNTHKMQKH